MASSRYRPSGLYKQDVTRRKEHQIEPVTRGRFPQSVDSHRLSDPKTSKDPYSWFAQQDKGNPCTTHNEPRRRFSPEVVEKQNNSRRSVSPEVQRYSSYNRSSSPPHRRLRRSPIKSRSPVERGIHYQRDSPKDRPFSGRSRDPTFGQSHSLERHSRRSPERSSPQRRRFDEGQQPHSSYQRRSRTPPRRYERSRTHRKRSISPQQQEDFNSNNSYKKNSSPSQSYREYPERAEELLAKLTEQRIDRAGKSQYPDISTNKTLLDKSKSLITVFDPEVLDHVKVVDKPSKPAWQGEEPLNAAYVSDHNPDVKSDQLFRAGSGSEYRPMETHSRSPDVQEYENVDAEMPSYSWVGEYLDSDEDVPQSKDVRSEKSRFTDPSNTEELHSFYKSSRDRELPWEDKYRDYSKSFEPRDANKSSSRDRYSNRRSPERSQSPLRNQREYEKPISAARSLSKERKSEAFALQHDPKTSSEEQTRSKTKVPKISFKVGKGETRQFGPSSASGQNSDARRESDGIDGFELTDYDMARFDTAEAISRIQNIFKKQQAIEEKARESKTAATPTDLRRMEPYGSGGDTRSYQIKHDELESKASVYPKTQAPISEYDHHRMQYRSYESQDRRDFKNMSGEDYSRDRYKYRALEQMDKREVKYSRREDHTSEADVYSGREVPFNSSRHVVSKEDASRIGNDVFVEDSRHQDSFQRRRFDYKHERIEAEAIPRIDGKRLSDSSNSIESVDDFWGFAYVSWFSKNILGTKQFETFAQNVCPPSVADKVTELPLRFLHCLASSNKHAVRCIPKQGAEAKELLRFVGLYKNLEGGMNALCDKLGMDQIPETSSWQDEAAPAGFSAKPGIRKVVDYDATRDNSQRNATTSQSQPAKHTNSYPRGDYKITVITSAPSSEPSKRIEVIGSTSRREEKHSAVSKVPLDLIGSRLKPIPPESSQLTKNKNVVSSNFPQPKATIKIAQAPEIGRTIKVDPVNITIKTENQDMEKPKFFQPSAHKQENITRTLHVSIPPHPSHKKDYQSAEASKPVREERLSGPREHGYVKGPSHSGVGFDNRLPPPHRRASPPKQAHTAPHDRRDDVQRHSDPRVLKRSTAEYHRDERPPHTRQDDRHWLPPDNHRRDEPPRKHEPQRRLLRRDFADRRALEREGRSGPLYPAPRDERRPFTEDSNPNRHKQGYSNDNGKRGGKESNNPVPYKTRRLSSSNSADSLQKMKKDARDRDAHDRRSPGQKAPLPEKKPLQRRSPGVTTSRRDGQKEPSRKEPVHEKKPPQSSGSQNSPGARRDEQKEENKQKCSSPPAKPSEKPRLAGERRPSNSVPQKQKSKSPDKEANGKSQKGTACFGGTKKRLVESDNYSARPPAYSSVQKLHLHEFKKFVKNMAMKLLNLKYDFNKYDSMKIKDFLHDASMFRARNCKNPNIFSKEDVVSVLMHLFQHAETERVIPDPIKRQIKLKGPHWCEISFRNFKSLQEAVFRQCARDFKRAEKLSDCPLLSSVIKKFEIVYPQFCGDVKGLIQLWCWTNLAQQVMDSGNKPRETRSTAKAQDKANGSPESDANLKQWLCTAYDCPPYHASKYKNTEILSSKKWGNLERNKIINFVVSWFLGGYFKACYSHLESKRKASSQEEKPTRNSANQKETEQMEEEDMDLDDMVVMDDVLVEP